LYGITRAPVEEIERLAGDRQALVLVRGTHWPDYASLFSLNDPWYEGRIIAVHDLNPQQANGVIGMYPLREVWFYTEGTFTRQPQPYTEQVIP
jgi:hypothetical protein